MNVIIIFIIIVIIIIIIIIIIIHIYSRRSGIMARASVCGAEQCVRTNLLQYKHRDETSYSKENRNRFFIQIKLYSKKTWLLGYVSDMLLFHSKHSEGKLSKN